MTKQNLNSLLKGLDSEPKEVKSGWLDHLKNVKFENPKKSLKECMTIAKLTYKKNDTKEYRKTFEKTFKNPVVSPVQKQIIEDSPNSDFLEIKEKNINLRIVRNTETINKLLTILVFYKSELEDAEQKKETKKEEPTATKLISDNPVEQVLEEPKISGVIIPDIEPKITIPISKTIDSSMNYEPYPRRCLICNKRTRHDKVKIIDGYYIQRYYCKKRDCGFERIYTKSID